MLISAYTALLQGPSVHIGEHEEHRNIDFNSVVLHSCIFSLSFFLTKSVWATTTAASCVLPKSRKSRVCVRSARNLISILVCDTCEEVEATARVGAVWHALNEVTLPAFLCLT